MRAIPGSGARHVLELFWSCFGFVLERVLRQPAISAESRPTITERSGRRECGFGRVAERDAHQAGEFGLAIGF